MPDTSEKCFSDIVLDHKKLSECELVFEGKNNTRMYASRDPDGYHLLVHAVEFVSADPDTESIWDSKELVVQTIFKATCYFDGVRHLEFNRNGSQEDGYLYYPSMMDIMGMFNKLLEIMKEMGLEQDI